MHWINGGLMWCLHWRMQTLCGQVGWYARFLGVLVPQIQLGISSIGLLVSQGTLMMFIQ
uniref:Uncharacterized protein n=1 Tax=Rhizophora mucronata TaxID=61149 RepID=A0A2P2PLM5_RHIMU